MTLKTMARQWLLPFIDPRRLASLVHLPAFLLEWRSFRRRAPDMKAGLADLYPCLDDRTGRTPFDAHYLFQAAWLARRLAQTRPALHVDVGSSVNMLSVISAYQPTVFLDYRPLHAGLAGLQCVAGTATALPFGDGALESLSCLHVIEHIGLGRYGDPLDPRGSATACAELARVLGRGGRLYLSVPVGRERICFNAHRVFAPATIAALMPALRLAGFSLVDDGGGFSSDVSLSAADRLDYGCGLFEFIKDDA